MHPFLIDNLFCSLFFDLFFYGHMKKLWNPLHYKHILWLPGRNMVWIMQRSCLNSPFMFITISLLTPPMAIPARYSHCMYLSHQTLVGTPFFYSQYLAIEGYPSNFLPWIWISFENLDIINQFMWRKKKKQHLWSHQQTSQSETRMFTHSMNLIHTSMMTLIQKKRKSPIHSTLKCPKKPININKTYAYAPLGTRIKNITRWPLPLHLKKLNLSI